MVVYKAWTADDEAMRLLEARLEGGQRALTDRVGVSSFEDSALPSIAVLAEGEITSVAARSPSAHDWLTKMMDSFMVRGTRGPVTSLPLALDLERTWGRSAKVLEKTIPNVDSQTTNRYSKVAYTGKFVVEKASKLVGLNEK